MGLRDIARGEVYKWWLNQAFSTRKRLGFFMVSFSRHCPISCHCEAKRTKQSIFLFFVISSLIDSEFLPRQTYIIIKKMDIDTGKGNRSVTIFSKRFLSLLDISIFF
jgi:hypothetical protein